MLRSPAALLIFQCLGESVSCVFSLPVPSPVIGMLLLFTFAMFRPSAAEALEPTALDLLRHLSLLFIPAGVGIMVCAQAVRGAALAVIASLVVSTASALPSPRSSRVRCCGVSVATNHLRPWMRRAMWPAA